MMRKLLVKVMMIGFLAGTASGCAQVAHTLNGNVNLQGDIWWIQTKMFSEDKVFYCPAPANGPAQCKEAKMIEGPAAAK